MTGRPAPGGPGRLLARASLRARLLVLILGALLLLWMAVGIYTWIDTRHELDELLDSHLAQAAALLVARESGEIEQEDEDEHPPARRLEAPLLHRYAVRTSVQVWHEGRLTVRSAQAPEQPMATITDGYATVDIDGERWRVFAARGREEDVQVYVAEALDSRGAILRAVLRGLLVPLAISLPFLALAVALAVQQGLRPLGDMRRQLAARDPRVLDPLPADTAPAEIRPLVDALNGLFGRIDTMVAAERRFTADAAHELRTPIAGIRMQAQVALGATDDAERRHALAATLAGCDRASHLINQLLLLARLDALTAWQTRRSDLAALVRQTASDLTAVHPDAADRLTVDAPPRLDVDGDPALLAMLVNNLLDNAMRHSSGAAVTLSLAHRPAEDGGRWQLTVDDGGPGLDAAGLARLGERFFRRAGQASRGSGLGWSIVRRIAHVHGAALRVDGHGALGGLHVEVEGPCDRSPDRPPDQLPDRPSDVPSAPPGPTARAPGAADGPQDA